MAYHWFIGRVCCLFLCVCVCARLHVAAEMQSHQKAISTVKHISSSDTLKCEEGKKKASEREYSVWKKMRSHCCRTYWFVTCSHHLTFGAIRYFPQQHLSCLPGWSSSVRVLHSLTHSLIAGCFCLYKSFPGPSMVLIYTWNIHSFSLLIIYEAFIEHRLYASH